jgi:hypothetical protein
MVVMDIDVVVFPATVIVVVKVERGIGGVGLGVILLIIGIMMFVILMELMMKAQGRFFRGGKTGGSSLRDSSAFKPG